MTNSPRRQLHLEVGKLVKQQDEEEIILIISYMCCFQFATCSLLEMCSAREQEYALDAANVLDEVRSQEETVLFTEQANVQVLVDAGKVGFLPVITQICFIRL